MEKYYALINGLKALTIMQTETKKLPDELTFIINKISRSLKIPSSYLDLDKND